MNDFFDGYVISWRETPLGWGQYGVVFKARSPQGTPLAAKVTEFARIQGERAMVVEQMRREAAIHASLSHPNIVRVHHTVVERDRIIIFMDRLPHTLEDLLVSRGGRLSGTDLLGVADQLASAFLYLSKRGVMHRDLKPDNVLLESVGPSPTVYLADFGFAREVDLGKTVAGAPLYMAPEMLAFAPYDERVDVWSFGVLMYRLAFGGVPFPATSVPELQEAQRKPLTMPSEIHGPLYEVIRGALVYNAKDRWTWETVSNKLRGVTAEARLQRTIAILQSTVETLRRQNAALRAENDLLQQQLR